MNNGGPGYLTNCVPLTIPSTNWTSAGANNFFLPLIFEGISTRQCVITFGFSTNNQPPVALSRPFYLNLQKVTSLYEHWTVGDNTTTEWNQIQPVATNTLDSAVFGKPRTADEQNYILLVHGWRMQLWGGGPLPARLTSACGTWATKEDLRFTRGPRIIPARAFGACLTRFIL